jgi:hypothetical protein
VGALAVTAVGRTTVTIRLAMRKGLTMEPTAFDRLARTLTAAATRRATLATLLGGLAASRVAGDRTEAKRGRKRRGDRHRQRGHARRGRRQPDRQVEADAICFPGSPCIPGPAANLINCDFSGASLPNLNCKRCNVSGASLNGTILTGVNFDKANLQGACLVDADLTGATINNSTNLSGAIFCRTRMPNGSLNNSGCGKGTSCCPTCIAVGGSCGAGLGGGCCGGAACQNGVCRCPASKPLTCNGVCKQCCDSDDCPSGLCCRATCCGNGQVCSQNGCCTPGGACPVGFCGSVPDGCGGRLTCPCPPGETCCGATCVNTLADPANCGGCGNACSPTTTDTCSGGQCRCGAEPPCTDGLECVAGACQPPTCPASQCLESNICVDGNSWSRCGANGEPCQQCAVGEVCLANVQTCTACNTTAGGSFCDQLANPTGPLLCGRGLGFACWCTASLTGGDSLCAGFFFCLPDEPVCATDADCQEKWGIVGGVCAPTGSCPAAVGCFGGVTCARPCG